jgi:hypothetical protein
MEGKGIVFSLELNFSFLLILCCRHVFVQNASKAVLLLPRVEKRRTQKYLGLTMV